MSERYTAPSIAHSHTHTAPPRTGHGETALPFITVVMPVRNEERFIAQTLDMLVTQHYPADKFEILVVDGMSTDSTPQIVEEYSRKHPVIRLLQNTGMRSSFGRNIGFMQGRGDYFLVVDGHCHIPDDNLLRNVHDCFTRFSVRCLGRPQPLTPPDLTPFQHIVSLARASAIGHGGGSYIFSDYEGLADPSSNGAAYHRSVFSEIGYVDETFDACEDVEFNFRLHKAGIAAATSPRLTVHYYPRESISALFAQMKRYGLGRWLLALKHPDSVGITTLVPAAFVCMLLTLPLCIAAAMLAESTLPALPSITAACLYTLLVLAESLRISLRFSPQPQVDNSPHLSTSRDTHKGFSHAESLAGSSRRIGTGVPTGWKSGRGYCFTRLPLVFATIHAGLGWGFLCGFMQTLQKRYFPSLNPQGSQA